MRMSAMQCDWCGVLDTMPDGSSHPDGWMTMVIPGTVAGLDVNRIAPAGDDRTAGPPSGVARLDTCSRCQSVGNLPVALKLALDSARAAADGKDPGHLTLEFLDPDAQGPP
jgi:hypothetical protein